MRWKVFMGRIGRLGRYVLWAFGAWCWSCSAPPSLVDASPGEPNRPSEYVSVVEPPALTRHGCGTDCVEALYGLGSGYHADLYVREVTWGADGSAYAVGSFEESLTHPGGTLNALDYAQGFLLKVSETDSWVYTLDGPQSSELLGATLHPSGDIVVGGASDFSTGFGGGESAQSSVFLGRFRPDGTEVWTHKFLVDSPYVPNFAFHTINSVRAAPSGTVYAVGFRSDRKGFLAAYDDAGEELWWVSPHDDRISELVVTEDGVLVAYGDESYSRVQSFSASGELVWTSDLDTGGVPVRVVPGPSGQLRVFSCSDYQVTESRLDAQSGAVLQSELSMQNVQLARVVQRPGGELALAGNFWGDRFAVAGASASVDAPNDEDSGVFVLGLDSSGQGLWAFAGGGGFSDAHVSGLSVASDGRLLLGATLGSTLVREPDPSFEAGGQIVSYPHLGVVLELNPSQGSEN